MRHYEVMIILDPSVEDKTVTALLDRFLKVITDAQGVVDNVDIWGKRRFAYEIDKKSEGIYVVVNLRAPSEAVAELDRQLSLNESILRTKVLRLPENAPAVKSVPAQS